VLQRARHPASLWTVGIGHVVINLPLAFAIIYASMGAHQQNAERAARDLGADEARVLVHVTVPMLAPAMIAAFFLAVTFSWDEFIIAFLLSRFDVTLPVEIWSLLRSGLNPKTNAIGSIVFLVSILVVLVLETRRPSGGAAHDRGVTLRGMPCASAGPGAAGIDLPSRRGEYAVLLGPSGCGKSTLLAILGGFLEPTQGRVLIGGRDVTDLPPARGRPRPCSRTTRSSRT
jgi:hypothetical protein